MSTYKICVLFGGTGFIGTHFARYLLTNEIAEKVFLADLQPIERGAWPQGLLELCKSGQIEHVPIDVRCPIQHPALSGQVDLIGNFAAVHRDPGHEAHEYYATNLPGAETFVPGPSKLAASALFSRVASRRMALLRRIKTNDPCLFQFLHMEHLSWWPKKFILPGSLQVKAAVC